MEKRLAAVLQPHATNIEVVEELKAYKEYFGDLPNDIKNEKNNLDLSELASSQFNIANLEFLLKEYENEEQVSEPLTDRKFADLQIDILRQFPNYIYWKDINGIYCGCNDNFAAYLGLKRPIDIIGKTDDDLFDPKTVENNRQTDQLIIRTKQAIYDVEERVVEEGAKNVLNIRKMPLFDERRKIVGILGYCWYKSESLLAVRKLRESEQRFRSYVENCSDSVCEIDQEGQIYFASTSFQANLGYEPSELVGKYLYEFIPVEDWQKISAKLPNHNGLLKFEHELKHKNNTWKYYESVISSANTLRQHIVYSRDISERRENEHLLKSSKENLEELVSERTAQLTASNQFLEQFAHQAGHDLRQPLRMIDRYLEIINEKAKDKFDEEEMDLLKYALGGAEQLRCMLDGIQQYTRLQKNGVSPESVNIGTLIDQVLRNLGSIIHHSKAIVDYNSSEMPTIIGYKIQLMQLFQNIIENSIKFGKAEKDPYIEIVAKENGDFYQFFVKDNGIGFEQSKSDEVFENFKRLNDFHEYKGSGMGLYICKEIVKGHGGDIWCESEIDKGAIFYFTLKKTLKKWGG